TLAGVCAIYTRSLRAALPTCTRLGAVVESGAAAIDEEADPSQGTFEQPAAIIPLMLDERTVGVIAIFATLAQKNRFHTVDFELRSEEHTSELQSRENLVCRLL